MKKSKSSRDFTSGHTIFDYLDECSVASLEYEQDNHDSCDSDIDHHLISTIRR